MMDRNDKQTALEQLNATWAEHDLPLKGGATQDVPGDGNPDAAVLFIGEAPGKNEDLQGKPFVGAAGKLLTQMIESIGLTRDEVFIANIIKHRPPGNRDPLPEEIEAYSPWLAEQISIIDPALIVTLGRFSMDYMLGAGHSISKIHGQPKRRSDGRIVMPMFHPAAALYRGDLRPVLAADFAKIPKVIALMGTRDTKTSDNSEDNEEVGDSLEQQKALL